MGETEHKQICNVSGSDKCCEGQDKVKEIGGEDGVAILCGLTREALPDKVMLRQKPEGESHACAQGKRILDREGIMCKGPEVGLCLSYLGTS